MTTLTRRQRQILDFITDFRATHGYAPSMEEIGQAFGLSSPATVHKHLTNLEAKGLIRRDAHRSRAIEVLETMDPRIESVELPLVGLIAAGEPLEAIAVAETVAVPPELVGRGRTYVLRVRGESMVDEHILDGDYVIVEERTEARDGEVVVALLDGEEATLKRLFHELDHIRLQPANPAMAPIRVQAENLQIQGVVIGVLRKYR
ncbi:transcriptional repressor LexA [Nitrospinae bacterium AH_259_B05_G02_I21]|nr:transcriptional repressor LexA [Nitrospinae bacterium AH_259_B05_G02_I21]MDA2932073.1 transcriptional repressor LexA [Nitrospinae bacterium AH-259-F20]